MNVYEIGSSLCAVDIGTMTLAARSSGLPQKLISMFTEVFVQLSDQLYELHTHMSGKTEIKRN